jgi:hypothetical protein
MQNVHLTKIDIPYLPESKTTPPNKTPLPRKNILSKSKMTPPKIKYLLRKNILLLISYT